MAGAGVGGGGGKGVAVGEGVGVGRGFGFAVLRGVGFGVAFGVGGAVGSALTVGVFSSVGLVSTAGSGGVSRVISGGGSWAKACPTQKDAKINKQKPRVMWRLISNLCKPCQTLYQSAMKTAFASIIMTILAVFPAQGKSPRHCQFRVHVEANAQDTSSFSSAIKAKLSGREVAIEKIPRISEWDVVAFQPYSAGPGDYGALIELDNHGRLSLDALSIEKRGGFIFIFINGRAITEMQIDKRVSDGKIYIPSGLTAADLKLMKKDWKVIEKHK